MIALDLDNNNVILEEMVIGLMDQETQMKQHQIVLCH